MSENLRSFDLKYSSNGDPVLDMYKEQANEVNTGKFAFSYEAPLYAVASACTVAILEEEDGRFGLFHGPHHDRVELTKTEKEVDDLKALDDFLDEWKKTSKAPVTNAYIFGNSPFDNTEEMTKTHREIAVKKISDATGLDRDNFLIEWNRGRASGLDVLIHPTERTIYASLFFRNDAD